MSSDFSLSNGLVQSTTNTNNLPQNTLPSEQLQAGLAQTTSYWQQIKNQLKEQYPTASNDELNVLFVQKMYSEELAREFARALAQKRTTQS